MHLVRFLLETLRVLGSDVVGLSADGRVGRVRARRGVDDAGRRGVRLRVYQAHARVRRVALVHRVQRDGALGVLDTRVVGLPRLGRGEGLSVSL